MMGPQLQINNKDITAFSQCNQAPNILERLDLTQSFDHRLNFYLWRTMQFLLLLHSIKKICMVISQEWTEIPEICWRQNNRSF